jgi:hypothetical protein
MYRAAVDVPVHYQWDLDSRFPLPDPGSAPDNCGPTSVANVAHFYTDHHTGIYRTRILAAPPLGPTSVVDQRSMLEKRGVPCFIGQWPVSSITKVVAGGRHPMILGLYYALVPYEVAGHPFRGWHSIEVLDNAVHNGIPGKLIRDPNFNRTYRQDPTNGRRFYPDWVIEHAFASQPNAWGIMPSAPKAVPLPDTSTAARVEGDPAPMKFRAVDQRRTVREGKPLRAGYTVNSRVLETTDERKAYDFIGRIPEQWLPAGERPFGDVLITRYYTGSGHVLAYVKQVDLAGN